MKNFTLVVITFLAMSFNLFGTTTPAELINHADLEVTMDADAEKNYIIFSAYNIENQMMEFVLKNPVVMIQIYTKEGELEMMVPVQSDEVSLGLSQFTKGNYKLGFILEGVDAPQFMDLTVN